MHEPVIGSQSNLSKNWTPKPNFAIKMAKKLKIYRFFDFSKSVLPAIGFLKKLKKPVFGQKRFFSPF